MNYMYKLKTILFILILAALTPLVGAADSYYYDEEQRFTVDTIKNAQFTAFEGKINKGLNNGVYWLRIGPDSESDSIIQIQNNRIKNVTAFQNGAVIDPMPNYGYLSYEVGLVGFPVLLKITADKEAYIPIEKFAENEFLKNEQLQSLLLGLFYGFALMVVIVNLFYFFNLHDNSFLFYAIFILSIAAGMSVTDGLLQILGIPDALISHSESLVYGLVGLTATLFSIDYLQMKSHYPKFRFSLYLAVVISFVFDVVYFLTNDYFYVVLSYFSTYYVFFACWAVSLLLFRKSTYAAFFCVAYLLFVIFVSAHFLAPAVGLPNLGINMNILKIGGYFEMLIITYAVVLRMNYLKSENNRMYDEILLFTQEINALSNQLSENQKTDKDHFAQFDLSNKENEILNLIIQNKRNKEIANDLFISVNTVKFHIKNIYRKLQIKNRKQIRNVINLT